MEKAELQHAVKQGAQNHGHANKLEPLIEHKGNGQKAIAPKPSVSPDLQAQKTML